MRLIDFLNSLNWTQTRLSQEAHVSIATVQRLVQEKPISRINADKICDTLSEAMKMEIKIHDINEMSVIPSERPERRKHKELSKEARDEQLAYQYFLVQRHIVDSPASKLEWNRLPEDGRKFYIGIIQEAEEEGEKKLQEMERQEEGPGQQQWLTEQPGEHREGQKRSWFRKSEPKSKPDNDHK